MKKTILAVDVGFGNTKLVSGRDGETWSELCFKSVAPELVANPAGLAGSLSPALDRIAIDVGSSSFLVGPDAFISGGDAILSTDYVNRDEYLALLRGAIYYSMKRSGQMHRHIDVLVMGLPVSNWRLRQAELIRIGAGPHRIPVPLAMRAEFGISLEVSVGKVLVMPQPMGALQFAIHEMSSKAEGGGDDIHMVIDPGFNTFDWFTSVGLRPDLQRSGSLQGGVSQLLKLVSNAAGAKLGVGSLNLNEVEKGLRKGVMNVFGHRLEMAEFQPIMQSAAREIVERFLNSINLRLGIDTIHLTGGGAPFYLEALRKAFSGYDIRLEPASVMQNARGFYLVGQAVAAMM